MKKFNAAFVSLLFASIFLFSIVYAAEDGSWTVNFDDDQGCILSSDTPIVSSFSHYVFGIYDLENTEFSEEYGCTSVFIVFLLIWLILFVTFSDIIAAFSSFSLFVSWIVGFAMTVIAANLKIVQIVAIWGITITSIFGAISVFVGLGTAFVAFIAISLGLGKFQKWAIRRKMGMLAHRGITQMDEGVKAMRHVGKDVMKSDYSI